MKLLDTSVVLYALGKPHPYKAACQRIVEDIEEGSSAYTIDVELLQEVVYVYASRGERERALTVVDLLLDLFPEPIPVTRHEIALMPRVLRETPSLSPRDAIHAAVVLRHGLEGLVTTDKAFLTIPGLTVFDPIEPL